MITVKSGSDKLVPPITVTFAVVEGSETLKNIAISKNGLSLALVAEFGQKLATPFYNFLAT